MRTRMVTRTINVMVAKAICMDVTTVETKIMDLELTGVGTLSEKELMKALKKNYETDTFKVVAIQEYHVNEEMYGLTELDFIKYATRLDPNTRKMIEEEND